MTRILSEILEAREPYFRQSLQDLERASGHANHDIRLSAEVVQAVQSKLRQLGLDAQDTSPQELYQALQVRAGADDVRLERALRSLAASHVSAEAKLMDGLKHFLDNISADKTVFGIKPTTLRRLLKANPPRRVAKMLHYRSLDACLKHESPVALVAAALVLEASAWRRSWQSSYKKLQPIDFQSMSPQVVCPDGQRWQPLTDKIISEKAHSVIGLPELGTVVLLPLPAARPAGVLLATSVLAIDEMNAAAAASNYLKACQLRADFGSRVQDLAAGRAAITGPMANQQLSWQTAQEFLARRGLNAPSEALGPSVQSQDLYWHEAAKQLGKICPSLEFWHGNGHLSLIKDGQIVSLNLLDAAINCCNNLAYEARSYARAQRRLWNELALRYLNPSHLEEAMSQLVQPKNSQLVAETAVNALPDMATLEEEMAAV